MGDWGGEPDDFSGLTVEIFIDEPELAERVRALVAELLEAPPTRSDQTWQVTITDTPAAAGGVAGPIIVLADDADITAALRAGAAVLPISAGAAELRLAIRALRRGLLIAPAGRLALDPRAELGEEFDDGLAVLTKRELEVLALLAEGASNKVIARRLVISVHTVKFHVASILGKLNATGRTDAVAQAVRLGLLML